VENELPNAPLYDVPAKLLAEFGLRPGGATVSSYKCNDPNAVMVPVGELIPPVLGVRRGLDPKRLRGVLAAVVGGRPLPPLPVFRELGAPRATILDGAHRYYVSVAYGFASVPCEFISRDDAEVSYRYPVGQR
jgi:hypothetical protein